MNTRMKRIVSLLMAAAFIIPFFYTKSEIVKAQTLGQPSNPTAVGQSYQTTINGKSVTAQDYEVTVPFIDGDTTTNYYEKGYQDANEVLSKVPSTVTSTVDGQTVTFNKTNNVNFVEDNVHSGGSFPKTVSNRMTVNCGTADAWLGKYVTQGYTISYSDIMNSFPSPISETLVDSNADGSYHGQYALVWRGDKDSSGTPILAAEPYQGFYPSPYSNNPATLKRRPYEVIKPFLLRGAPSMTQTLTTNSYPIFINLPVGQNLDKSRTYEFNAITSNKFSFTYTATKGDTSETHTSYSLLSPLLLNDANNLKFYYKDYYDSDQYAVRDIVSVNGSNFSDAGNVTAYDMYGNASTFHRYTASVNLGYIVPSATYSYQAEEDLWLPTVTYRGTVYTANNSYKLNINYIDEDTDNVIASDKTKTYTSQDVSTDDMFGANAAEQWYLPSYTPPGYTLDTSKYTDIGYHIIWDADSKYSNYNGRSTTDTVNLKVYCKKIPINSYTLNISYIDEDTNKPISNIDGCETYKSYQESDLTMVTGGKVAYYLPASAPSGYSLDTSKYFNATKGYGILFDDDDPTTLPHNGYSSNKIADLQVYCKATAQNGTVVKRYFVDGIEKTEDEEKITDVPVGSHTYSADKSYQGDTCSNPSVTVDVKANDTVYADFKFTSTPVPVIEKGTVIKRYFLKGVEQTADEEKIENVEVGPHTYSAYKTYPRYTCENPSITVNVTANSVTYCDFNYGFENHPPTVHLYAPSTVVMGDNLDVNASGTDPDGDPLWYDWDTPSDFKGLTMNDTASGYFDSIGNKTFSVTVTDPYNASDYDSTVVKVVPPVPNVVIDKSGVEKENRKVTLDAEKYSSSGSKGRYQLDWSKAQWQFFDSNGNEIEVDNNPTSSTIVKSLQSTTGTKSMDLIFKKAGKYTAKCTLYNTAGYSNSFSVDLNIIPDLAPTADFYFPDGNNVLRDRKDLSPNGLVQASHRLADSSSSSDDSIGKRMWLACFDSDNDGSYDTITNNEDGTKKAVPEKEKWFVYDLDYNGDSDTRYKVQVPDSTPLSNLVTIGSDGHKYAYINDSLNPHWRYIGTCEDMQKLDINKINCGNFTSVTFKSTSVGNFDFEEVVQESFGQDTIPELITNNDIKQANTFNDQ